jgi:predicted Ser/Thr protein kinase
MSSKKIGRYEIRSELGRGGMATVYLAYDPVLEREVALKVLPTYFAHEPEFSARFAREAKTVAALEHNAIVSMYDYGEDGEWPYFVMQLMKGGSLKEKIEQGPLSMAEAAKILKRIGSALDRAHSRNLIHRDLKPGNILFNEDGDAYLTDFGIVKIVEGSDNYTQTGNTLGTPAYMSPEQARGVEEIDGRSDIYALGVILYEMLTGDVPYKSDTTLGQAMMHVMDPLPEILSVNPDLPPVIDEIIKKAMAKEKENRYATTGELAETVEAVANGESREAVAVPESVVAESAAILPILEAEVEPAPEAVLTAHVPVMETPMMEPTAVVTTPPAGAKPVAAATSPYDENEKKKGIPKWIYAVVGLVVIAIIVVFALVLGNEGNPNAVQLPAEPIQYSDSIRGSINSDEVANYTFSGNANDVVEVIVAPLTDGFDPVLLLLDSNGRSLTDDPIDNGIAGQPETLSNQRLPGIGTYTIAVRDYGSNSGNFIVTLELVSEAGQ